MPTAIEENLVKGNAVYAETFKAGELPLLPSGKYAVVTCMDSRIFPSTAFAVKLGSAHIIRNAGGSVREAFRSLVISQQMLKTEEVLIIKHTGCGMLTFDNAGARAAVAKNSGEEAAKEVADLDFLPFKDLEQAVRDDVEWLKAKKIESGVRVSGWIYEVETGKVRKVA
ncbi:carbonic anhydrase [Lepidopterella palustris CBS 459.81]|uniref:Carbonic anhydrase n=1 Tax=Lepidopterella palustris CBS 459.81 TaxID=1314670 RepID=A0A8E2EL43_9PEZI|nr:carbonic anhydrase [Lepidopterella palustris CBS 459.81]